MMMFLKMMTRSSAACLFCITIHEKRSYGKQSSTIVLTNTGVATGTATTILIIIIIINIIDVVMITIITLFIVSIIIIITIITISLFSYSWLSSG